MSVFYRILGYAFAVIIWALFVIPNIGEMDPALSFLIFVLPVLYIIGDDAEE